MDITMSEAAERLGVSRQRVCALCLKHGIGRLVNARLRLLSPADLRRLESARLPPGRPKAKRPRGK